MRTSFSPDRLWLAFFGLLSTLWCLHAAREVGATFDEPFYLKSGLHFWHTGSYQPLMRAGTMPLPVDVQTLPLRAIEAVRGYPIDLDAEMNYVLPIARGMNLVFWWLLLWGGLRLGRFAGGAWGGRLAVALLACEPNLLAHASLATTDIAVTAMMLHLVYLYVSRREDRFASRVVVPGLMYGIALSAKASALVFGPLCIAGMELCRLWQAGAFRCKPSEMSWVKWVQRVTSPGRWDLFWIVWIGLAFVFVFCATDFRPQGSFVKWADTLPEGGLRDGMSWFARNLSVFPNAGEAFAYQIKHNIRGHGSYLIGEWHPRALWYYFPVALLMKLSVPMLVLLALAVLRPRRLVTPLGAATLMLLLFSMNCRVQIGIRLVLPLVAMLAVLAAVSTGPLVAAIRETSRRRLVPAVLTLSLIAPLAMVWPHGISYINLLWGGPDEACHLLTDSNCDWGQGLPDLARWHEAHADSPLRVWYFGTDPAIHKPPFEHVKLHVLDLTTPEDLRAKVQGGWLAVARTLRYGNPDFTPSANVALDVLRGLQPAAGTETFLIYDLRTWPTNLHARR